MNPLQLFYANETMREALRAFMISTLREIAADRAFNAEDTLGIQEAAECVDKTFAKLEELYSKKKEPVIINSR